MKKVLVWLLALVMVLGLCACSDDVVDPTEAPSSQDVPTDSVEEPETDPAPSVDFEPVTAELGAYTVTILGAEAFKDSDGEDALRVYYDFTNNSDETECAFMALNFEVSQDGYPVETTYASYEDDVIEYGNDSLDVRPGVTIRCIAEYFMKADGGVITFTVSNYWTDEEMTVEFDPQNLPGTPTSDFLVNPITDPQWVAGWATEGTYNEDFYMSIDSMELTEDYDGNRMIRVYFTFTNNSDEATSMWWASDITLFQDGVELDSGYSSDGVETDDNYTMNVEPGQTVTCSECWILTSDSPVEVEIADDWSESYLGCIYTLN